MCFVGLKKSWVFGKQVNSAQCMVCLRVCGDVEVYWVAKSLNVIVMMVSLSERA